MRVYFDACCLSRLTDDHSQERVREEAQAIEGLLRAVREGTLLWVCSDSLIHEVESNPDEQRRLLNSSMLRFASETCRADENIEARAKELNRAGYDPFDASHLAFAEAANVDVLLTTDDRFIRKASRGVGGPRVIVQNPLSWLVERLS